MSKHRYTFEDWHSGKIAIDFRKGKIEEFKKCKKGNLVFKLYYDGLLSEEDYGKICQLKEKAFFNAVDLTVNTLFKHFEGQLKKVIDSDELLAIKIEELEEVIDKASRNTKKKVLSEEVDTSGMDYLTYLKIEYPEELIKSEIIKSKPKVIHLSNPSGIVDGNREYRNTKQFAEMISWVGESFFPDEYERPKGITGIDFDKYVTNKVYDLTVNWRLLKRLKNIEENPSSKDQSIAQNDFPDPKEIAKKFKKQSKTNDSPYSVKEYAFVMKYVRDNQDYDSIAALIRQIKREPNCPEKIKPENKADQSMRRWINFYNEFVDLARN